MNIIFRADANHNIGMGHVMRCLSIADSYKHYGHNVKFIIAEHKVENLIKERGFEVIVLFSDYTKLDEELKTLPQIINIDVLFIDSYYVTPYYLSEIKTKFNCTIVYIDDLHSFPYPVDVLINYNIYGLDINYKQIYSDSGTKCPQLLLGPSFAPLRQAFRRTPTQKQKKLVKNILISTGGADELHLALTFAKTITKYKPQKYKYHILLGSLNQDKEDIKAIAAKSETIVLHENVRDMNTLLHSMDIAISAAGSTLYEICACGVPLITYILADNQIPGATSFEKIGLAINVGDVRDKCSAKKDLSNTLKADTITSFLNAIEKLSNDYEQRVAVGMRMQKMIDGFGAERIVDAVAETLSH